MKVYVLMLVDNFAGPYCIEGIFYNLPDAMSRYADLRGERSMIWEHVQGQIMEGHTRPCWWCGNRAVITEVEISTGD